MQQEMTRVLRSCWTGLLDLMVLLWLQDELRAKLALLDLVLAWLAAPLLFCSSHRHPAKPQLTDSSPLLETLGARLMLVLLVRGIRPLGDMGQ